MLRADEATLQLTSELLAMLRVTLPHDLASSRAVLELASQKQGASAAFWALFELAEAASGHAGESARVRMRGLRALSLEQERKSLSSAEAQRAERREFLLMRHADAAVAKKLREEEQREQQQRQAKRDQSMSLSTGGAEQERKKQRSQ